MAYTLLLDGCEVGHVETEEEAVQWCLHYDGDHDPTYEEDAEATIGDGCNDY